MTPTIGSADDAAPTPPSHPHRLPAVPIGPGLRHDRGAARPLAAHAEAEQESEHTELPDVLRETTRSGKDRIDEDAQDHRRSATDTIRYRPEQHAADARRNERDRAEEARRRGR